MTDSLERFRSASDETAETDDSGVERTLLMFEYADQLIGVPAEAVDAVIAWTEPAPLPMARGLFAGVVQDRGRIITVLRAPVDALAGKEGAVHQRIIVCKTPHGFIGLPASRTRGVSEVRLAAATGSGEIVDSSEGPVTLVIPTRVLEARTHTQLSLPDEGNGRSDE